jgi:hypothetical protein
MIKPFFQLMIVAAVALTAAAGTSRNTDTSRPYEASPPVGRGASLPRPRARGPGPAPHGRIPILEYHIIGDHEARWTVEREHFRRSLQLLYDRGYRPITVSELIDDHMDLAPGQSPVVFTFDDASPSQFRYIEHDGQLEIDSTSAVGIWLAFHAKHPDWANRATFCALPAASAGHAFFGENGIEGQRTAWRFKKVQFLAAQGFELCDHTLWHANLGKYSDAVVQEQIARGAMAIDSALPGYHIRTFALPLGIWPKNRALAQAGSWTDPRTGQVIRYHFDAILEVSGGPALNPRDPAFNPLRLYRVEVFGNELERTLDELDRPGARYVVGPPSPVAVVAPHANP